MKKKLIRLASLWLAVLMLATTAFAADVYFGVYTGVESLDQWDYVRDSTEEVTLSSETDEFSLNTDAVLDLISESALGRELLGWNVWENISSGYLQDENPTTYEVDAIFTGEQLADQLVEPKWSEDVIRAFYIVPQLGDNHNEIIENNGPSVLEEEMMTLLWHNFDANGAFSLESDDVTAAVKLLEGYAVEGWRIWTPGEEGELVELPALDFDAVIEEDSELLQLECEGYLLCPVVSKLAEITQHPTAEEPTVKTDADDNDALDKAYEWYRTNAEAEIISPESDENRLIIMDDLENYIFAYGKWYSVQEMQVAAIPGFVALREGETVVVTTGSDGEEATPTAAMLVVTAEMSPEGFPETGTMGVVFGSNGVFKYSAKEDTAAMVAVMYGDIFNMELASSTAEDYIAVEVVDMSDIEEIEGETKATLSEDELRGGYNHFVKVTVSDEADCSAVLTSNMFYVDYAITEQPTADEPTVGTNNDDAVVSYTWYEVGEEEDILLDEETEATLSEGEDGTEYYVEVEFEDETVLESDSFEWKTPKKKPQGSGGLQAGGDTSNKGADKVPEQSKPETDAPETNVPETTVPDDSNGQLESDKLFDDAPVGSWFEPAAEWMGKNGYMTGTAPRTFSPNVNTTRGMIVTVLWRMAGSPAPQGECPFEDVAEGSYYEDAITWAAENGIVTGNSEKTFAPDDLIIREQLAAIIYRNEVRKGMEALTMEENLTHFTDADAISEYAITAMNWAVGQGIINGINETTLAPKKTATRAECAAMLYRMENK